MLNYQRVHFFAGDVLHKCCARINAAQRHFPEQGGTGTNWHVPRQGTTRLPSTAKPALDVAGDASVKVIVEETNAWNTLQVGIHGKNMYSNNQSGANMSVFQAGTNNLILSSSNFLCEVSAGKMCDFSDYEKISNNIFDFDLSNFIHISVPPV